MAKKNQNKSNFNKILIIIVILIVLGILFWVVSNSITGNVISIDNKPISKLKAVEVSLTPIGDGNLYNYKISIPAKLMNKNNIVRTIGAVSNLGVDIDAFTVQELLDEMKSGSSKASPISKISKKGFVYQPASYVYEDQVTKEELCRSTKLYWEWGIYDTQLKLIGLGSLYFECNDGNLYINSESGAENFIH